MLGINYCFSNTFLDEFQRQFTQAYQRLRGSGQGTRRTQIAPHLAQRLWRDNIVQSLYTLVSHSPCVCTGSRR